jgi:twinkle protein
MKTMKTLAKRHGVKLFIIDNLQAVLHEDATSLYSDQANFVQDCADFAASHNVHVILVAHPRKVNELKVEEKEPDYGVLEKTDVSGTKGITNKAHNIVSVERDFEGVYFDMIVTNLKDKHEGNRKAFKYRFSKNTFRFYNEITPENIDRPWEKLVKQFKAIAIKEAFTFDD